MSEKVEVTIPSKVIRAPIETKEGGLIDLIDEYVRKTDLKIERQEPGQAPFIEIRDRENRKNAIRIAEDNCQ